MYTTSSCHSSFQKWCKYSLLTLINLIVLITLTRDANNPADSGALIKGTVLAVLDLDGLD